MKKLLCVVLAAVMLAGLGVGAGAEDIEPPDTSTWPVLVLNQPMTLEFYGYSEGFDGPSYPAYMSLCRFIPAESGSYFFEILGPDTLGLRMVYVTTNDFISVWDDDILPGAGKVAQLEGRVEHLVVAQVVSGSTGNFQVVARKYVPSTLKWWQKLPSFLQFLLRWLCFGWIWMR